MVSEYDCNDNSAYHVCHACLLFATNSRHFFPQDEFGYWNNAARIIGLDWSQIADGQSSYAYGYSLVYC